MNRVNLILGKTTKEANEILKNLGYFVSEDNELRYINQIPIKVEEGLITAVWQAGKWRTEEDK